MPEQRCFYTCPDCHSQIDQGSHAHQHANGEWVQTEDLRRFYQTRRWEARAEIDSERLKGELEAAEQHIKILQNTRERDGRIAVRLRAALERVRQGYQNILEMRRLDSAKWGQADGYGGRYGALTREEIEAVITEIDCALKEG